MRPFHLCLLLSIALVSKGAVGNVLGDPDDYVNDDDEEDDGNDEEDDASDAIASIISQPQTIRAAEGSNITLHCKISNPENEVIEWLRGEVKLFMEGVSITYNSRLSITGYSDLHITAVTPEDAGNYSCKLLNSGDTLIHTVNVLTRAVIESFNISRDYPESNTRHIVWMKGSRQNISCVAKGYPPPEVTISHVWLHGKHKGSEIQVLHGNPVIIDPVDRRHAGKYTCEAKNQQFLSTKGLQVEVEYAPEVHVRREYVSTSEGFETSLLCRVIAHPAATVSWKKNNEPLSIGGTLSNRIDERIDGSHHTLIISRTEQSDFGWYTCNAANVHGTSFKDIKVSGHPSKPVIESISFEGSDPIVTWKVQSLAKVDSFKVQFKKQQDNDWEEIILNIDESGRDNGDMYVAKHKFNHLDEGTYRIQGLAKNSYGWSEPSEEKHLPGSQYY